MAARLSPLSLLVFWGGLSAAGTATDVDLAQGALIGIAHGGAGKDPPQMDIFIAAGRGDAFEFDEIAPSSVSVAFHHAMVVGVDDTPAGSALLIHTSSGATHASSFRVDGLPLLPSGFLCTVTFASDTVLEHVGIDFGQTDTTWLEAAGQIITWPGDGPAFVVMSGDDDTKRIRVFTGHRSIRSLQLAFAGPTSGAGAIVRPEASYATASGAAVSAFAGGHKIGWGCFGDPFTIPTTTTMGTLAFVRGFSLEALDLRSSDTLVETAGAGRLRVIVVHGRGAFLLKPDPGSAPALTSHNHHDEL
jgi:hypothetical protein